MINEREKKYIYYQRQQAGSAQKLDLYFMARKPYTDGSSTTYNILGAFPRCVYLWKCPFCLFRPVRAPKKFKR